MDTAYNKWISGYGALHLRPNPRLSARTSDARKRYVQSQLLIGGEIPHG